jgi:hypothetical protein
LRQKHQSFEKMVHLANIPNNPSLILDCPARWNSTFEMINRFIKLKRLIEIFITSDNTLKNFSMTQKDWQIVTELKTLLQPLDDITKNY